jgi:hypothetical protein
MKILEGNCYAVEAQDILLFKKRTAGAGFNPFPAVLELIAVN